jgi:signal peptidase II
LGDQWSKWLIERAFTPGQSLPILSPVLHLTYVQNTGAAFGLFKGMTALLSVLSAVVAAWISLELRRSPRGDGKLWALSLVLGGALGNLIDRVWRGYVVDFIDLRIWPVFNLADSAITIGVIWLLLPLALSRSRNAEK